ncbi:MAG: glucuronate isomerase, partial [Gammaproteobacteria bacterium]|nr:glucuronate isomerase [Gammaproteobacteria bacterium]
MRSIALRLFGAVEALPIISPHGHTDPRWFSSNEPFEDAVSLLLWPDHYLLRMLMSQGVTLESLGVRPVDDAPVAIDRRSIWRLFAQHYRVFRATPSRLWLDHVFATVFGFEVRLTPETADQYFDTINAALATPEYRPRALYERFGIEVLATTEGALDALEHHAALAKSGWKGRIITTFRPDDVVDPDRPDFIANVARLGELAREDTSSWRGYL